MKYNRIVFLGWLIIVIIASSLLSVSSTYELEVELVDTNGDRNGDPSFSVVTDWTLVDSNSIEGLLSSKKLGFDEHLKTNSQSEVKSTAATTTTAESGPLKSSSSTP